VFFGDSGALRTPPGFSALSDDELHGENRNDDADEEARHRDADEEPELRFGSRSLKPLGGGGPSR
jgi:hypothetical protein